MKYYFKALMHYADFNGRASRKEYWHFSTVHILVLACLFFIGTAVGHPYLLCGIYFFATLPPTFAVAARRAHDIGLDLFSSGNLRHKLGYTVSDKGENQYGPEPVD